MFTCRVTINLRLLLLSISDDKKWKTMVFHAMLKSPRKPICKWRLEDGNCKSLHSLLTMMDQPGQYANILYITQSLTFKTLQTQNIPFTGSPSSTVTAAVGRTGLTSSNKRFIPEQFLAGASSARYGNYQMADWYLLQYSGSVCVLIREHVYCVDRI